MSTAARIRCIEGIQADSGASVWPPRSYPQPQRLMAGFSLLCAVLLCAGVAHAKPTIRKDRVLHPDPELSRQAHEDNKSFQYDHEAFLGKEEAKTFDQLTPEESKDRLG